MQVAKVSDTMSNIITTKKAKNIFSTSIYYLTYYPALGSPLGSPLACIFTFSDTTIIFSHYWDMCHIWIFWVLSNYKIMSNPIMDVKIMSIYPKCGAPYLSKLASTL